MFCSISRRTLTLMVIACLAVTQSALAFDAIPRASVQMIGGTPFPGTNTALFVVVETPSNTGDPITHVILDTSDFTATGTGVLAVAGQGSGTISNTAFGVAIYFTNALRPGSTAYLRLTNVATPITTGVFTLTVTATGASGASVEAPARAGMSLSLTIDTAYPYYSLPYSRVFLFSGNGANNSGTRSYYSYGAYNTYTYLVYNPHDSMQTYTTLLVTAPQYFYFNGYTRIAVTNLKTGLEMVPLFNPPNYTAGENKVMEVSLTTPLAPGETAVVFIASNYRNANGGSAYPFDLEVRTAAGLTFPTLPMRGYTMPEEIGLNNSGSGYVLLDFHSSFSLETGTMGWPTMGYSNNVYRLCACTYRGAWSIATHNPLKISNANFNLSSAVLTEAQLNNTGPDVANSGVSNGSYFHIPISANATGGYSRSVFFTVTNVVNPMSAGVFTMDAVYGAGGTPFSTRTYYEREVLIVSNLFTNVNLPATGIFAAGSPVTNAESTYMLTLHNPTNAGDGIDVVKVTLPAGFVFGNVSTDDVALYASAGEVLSVSRESDTLLHVIFDSDAPLGEGATAYIALSVTNASLAGTYAAPTVTVSGAHDIVDIAAEGTLPTYLLSSAEYIGSITVVESVPVDTNDYTLPSVTRTNTSGDGYFSVITEAGTFSDIALMTISNKSSFEVFALPPFAEEGYSVISNAAYSMAYSFSVTLPATKPLTMIYSYAPVASIINDARKLALAYYDSVENEWVIDECAVSTNSNTVVAKTMRQGIRMLVELDLDLTPTSNAYTNTSSDGLLSVVSEADTFAGDCLITVSNIAGVYLASLPSFYAQGYRQVIDVSYSMTYDVRYSLSPLKPLTYTLRYADVLSHITREEKLLLAYFDESMSNYTLYTPIIDTNAHTLTVSSYAQGSWILVEQEVDYSPPDGLFTNRSEDGLVYVVSTNGTFTENALVTVSNIAGLYLTSVPEFFLPGYQLITSSESSLAYYIEYSRPPQEALEIVFSYTNHTNVIDTPRNLKLMRYDASLSNWSVHPSVVSESNGTVSARSLQYGIWRMCEELLAADETSVSALYGATFTSVDSNLTMEILPQGLSVDSVVKVEAWENVPFTNNLREVSGVYRVSSTASLVKPATITIAFTSNEIRGKVLSELRIASYDDYTGDWRVVPTTLDANAMTLSTTTREFTAWAIVEDRLPTTNKLVSDVYTYPTPSTTGDMTVSFSIDRLATVSVAVFDRYGKRVAELTGGGNFEDGLVELSWDGKTDSGHDVPNGVYLVKITVRSSGVMREEHSEVRKVVISR